jgi:hypothetical protein
MLSIGLWRRYINITIAILDRQWESFPSVNIRKWVKLKSQGDLRPGFTILVSYSETICCINLSFGTNTFWFQAVIYRDVIILMELLASAADMVHIYSSESWIAETKEAQGHALHSFLTVPGAHSRPEYTCRGVKAACTWSCGRECCQDTGNTIRQMLIPFLRSYTEWLWTCCRRFGDTCCFHRAATCKKLDSCLALIKSYFCTENAGS